MKIGILSNDEKQNQALVKILGEFSTRRLIPLEITTYHSGKNFLNSAIKFDILFVDDTGSQLGFRETIKMCKGKCRDACIVVVSESREHMGDAFEFQIHRFLIKPLTRDSVFEALDACRRTKFANQAIVIKTASGFKSVRMADVVFVEAERKVATIHTVDEPIATYTPFSDMLEQLPEEYFFICHRSIIINMDCVEEFGAAEIKMRTGDYVPLSRRRKSEFYITYNKYIKSHSIS